MRRPSGRKNKSDELRKLALAYQPLRLMIKGRLPDLSEEEIEDLIENHPDDLLSNKEIAALGVKSFEELKFRLDKIGEDIGRFVRSNFERNVKPRLLATEEGKVKSQRTEILEFSFLGIVIIIREFQDVISVLRTWLGVNPKLRKSLGLTDEEIRLASGYHGLRRKALILKTKSVPKARARDILKELNKQKLFYEKKRQFEEDLLRKRPPIRRSLLKLMPKRLPIIPENELMNFWDFVLYGLDTSKGIIGLAYQDKNRTSREWLKRLGLASRKENHHVALLRYWLVYYLSENKGIKSKKELDKILKNYGFPILTSRQERLTIKDRFENLFLAP